MELRRKRDEVLGREGLGAGVFRQAQLGQGRAGGGHRARPAVLQRAGEGLAAVGEGGADQVAGRRVRPRPVRRRRRIAESTRGRGRKTAGSTLRTSSTSQAIWATTLGEP